LPYGKSFPGNYILFVDDAYGTCMYVGTCVYIVQLNK